jgi:UDP-N-acetylglucosamine/UDP-N-acetylgalactosamine diphosphorylase
MTWTLAEAEAYLRRHQQEHVLRFWSSLAADQRGELLQQLKALDLDWLRRAASGELAPIAAADISPYSDVIRLNDAAGDAARQRGEAALRAGQVATLLVAGGQGSRLGFEGPKGALPIGPISGHTLFQLHAERQLALGRRYGVVPRLYVMTSPDNHEATQQLFVERDWFGLPRERVLLFAQGVAPATDDQGRLLLAERHRLVLTANGNGGLFAALRDSGALAQMHDDSIEALSYIQVDNPLSPSCDPRFVGYHLERGADFSCKAIAKRDPAEKVGHYASVRGRLAIVEYGELPDEMAHRREPNGELTYGFANPGLFVWSREFLQAQADRDDLPVHRAHKKIAHLSANGQPVAPDRPNGYKLELFALDTLPLAQRPIVVECSRAAEFAPVKNASGADSPADAQRLLLALHRSWLNAAGARVKDDVRVEISPLFALDAIQLSEKVGPADSFEADTYLAPHEPLPIEEH